MFSRIRVYVRRMFRHRSTEIYPEEIFIDSQNLPEFNQDQFEGRLEKPIGSQVYTSVSFFLIFLFVVFTYRLWDLQIRRGEVFRQRSNNNSVEKTIIFADRGLVVDRFDVPLIWNEPNTLSDQFSLRRYATSSGLSTFLGYVKYPTKDSSGFYYRKDYVAKDGLEQVLNTELSGKQGAKVIERDVKAEVVSESLVLPPKAGQKITLSLDSRLQKELHTSMLEIADRAGYKGGSGIIVDVHTGEILALSNFPEYDSQVMTDGSDNTLISEWLQSSRKPFLNRAIDGLYTPGSVVKLFVAIGVLEEGVIDPRKNILSTGSISIPNPFFPDKPSVFMDWKAHGYVDMREAIAVSSNVYFYAVGGGFGDQKGIGIDNIEKYTRAFGLGTTTGIHFPGEKPGTIPNPAWKKQVFAGEPWRVGDTYNTAIGQYGFQTSPIQVAMAVAALANNGTLLQPQYIKGAPPVVRSKIPLSADSFRIVKEGMREGVTSGTSQAINFPFVEVASKTGTAQIGISKEEVNSWVVGFWPYQNPKYAYTVVMERGSKNNQFGSVLVMHEFFKWMELYAPEYLK